MSADESHDHQSRMKLLYTSRDSMEASLLEAMLEGAGIAVRLSGGNAAMGFGELPSDALQVEIWVPATELEQGARLLEAHWKSRKESSGKGSGEGNAQGRPATAWSCAACGELNEASFDLCWNCQAAPALEGSGG